MLAVPTVEPLVEMFVEVPVDEPVSAEAIEFEAVPVDAVPVFVELPRVKVNPLPVVVLVVEPALEPAFATHDAWADVQFARQVFIASLVSRLLHVSRMQEL